MAKKSADPTKACARVRARLKRQAKTAVQAAAPPPTITHRELLDSLKRPAGVPVGECQRSLVQVDAWGRSPNPRPASGSDLLWCDQAQADEGPPGSTVAVAFYRCECGATLVVARLPVGAWRLRNEYYPSR